MRGDTAATAVVWGWVLDGEWNLVWVLLLICKVGLAGAPTSWLAHLQTPQLPNMQQQVHQSRGPDMVCLGCQAYFHIGRLPSYNLGEPYAQPFSDSSAFFKTDRLPTASLPSLHTLYLASLLFFKHDGLTVFSDNLWLINEQPSSWIKVFYEKWCPSSFLSLPKYVNIFQLKPGRILQEGAVLHWHKKFTFLPLIK